jgi:hypothetical protein
MFKQLLVLCFLSMILVTCTSLDKSGGIVDNPTVGSKEGSDVLFDQTINSATDNTKKIASSAK